MRIIKRTDVNSGDVWFVEDSRYCKLSGPFLTEEAARLSLWMKQQLAKL